MTRSLRGFGAVTALALVAAPAAAQVRIVDLVFTGGVSAEGYRGNFSAVSVQVVDSTNHASAAVGEFGLRGTVLLLEDPGVSRVNLLVDAGVRQFAAAGFELRDYAPREWTTSLDLSWARRVSSLGQFSLFTGFRGRAVDDRPPMPLFLQPGYSTWRGGVRFHVDPIQGVAFDAEVGLRRTNYDALSTLSQLDLLDRRARGFTIAATAGGRHDWTVRFHTGFETSEYRGQASFDPDDPFRRDRTVTLGAEWNLEADVLATLGVEATVNRSNSTRPEYDAVSVNGEFSMVLPWWDLSTNLYSLVTLKSYVHETEFARLVPGEEADNASLIYLDLARPLAINLEGVLRFGWTRAETDIGRSYYSRFGTTFLLNFRPSF